MVDDMSVLGTALNGIKSNMVLLPGATPSLAQRGGSSPNYKENVTVCTFATPHPLQGLKLGMFCQPVMSLSFPHLKGSFPAVLLPTFSNGSNLVPYASMTSLSLPLRPVCQASYRHLEGPRRRCTFCKLACLAKTWLD